MAVVSAYNSIDIHHASKSRKSIDLRYRVWLEDIGNISTADGRVDGLEAPDHNAVFFSITADQDLLDVKDGEATLQEKQMYWRGYRGSSRRRDVAAAAYKIGSCRK